MNEPINTTRGSGWRGIGMRTYEQLSVSEQGIAKSMCLDRLLTGIIDGCLRFSDKDNGDNLQARIDKAIKTANRKKTPWFAHEYILDTCREDLEGIALCNAEDAFYPNDDEYIVRLV